MENDIMEYTAEVPAAPAELSPEAQLQLMEQSIFMVREAARRIMRKDQHYGIIPGCGKKPTLLKPGAEILLKIFNIATIFTNETIDLGGGHRECICTCKAVHIPTGRVISQDLGSCSTMEDKYRYRTQQRTCPQCGAETIGKSKEEYGGGYFCNAKNGGCGAKFAKGDPAIENQEVGKVENPDIANTYNTVLKMAVKRAKVAAALSCTCASDIFIQDVEDYTNPAFSTPARPAAKPAQARAPRRFPDAVLRADAAAPAYTKLDLPRIEQDCMGCNTIEELDKEIKGLNISKGHPDAEAIKNIYNNAKSMINSTFSEVI
jgi:hypothetical protein